MGIYEKYVMPKLVHFTCGLKPTMKQREKVVPLAESPQPRLENTGRRLQSQPPDSATIAAVRIQNH